MWQPDITVASICEKDGRFLIVEEQSKSINMIVFNQPAGHLEDGESIVQAVIRETLEETCRHFIHEHLVGIYRLRSCNGKTYIRVTFCGKISDVDPNATMDSDIIKTHWLSLAELEQSNMLRSDLVLSCINDYINGQRYPLSILCEL